MEFKCKICFKNYASYQSMWKHVKTIHKMRTPELTQSIILPQKTTPVKNKIKVAPLYIKLNTPPTQFNITCKHDNIKLAKNKLTFANVNEHICIYCNKNYTRKDNLSRHQYKCKNKKNLIDENIFLKTEVDDIKNKLLNNLNINDDIKKIETKSFNNQLMNIITEKNKTIEELKDKNIDLIKKTDNIKIPIEKINERLLLIINNIIIDIDSNNTFINATKLCQAENKNYDDWFNLENTKILIDELFQIINSENNYLKIESNLQLININNSEYWLHPLLIIQLAQWISPLCALQVSHWILNLFADNKVKNSIILKNKETLIKLKNYKIQLLEDMCIKKQHRKIYPQKNIIYMLTTEDNKKKRIYIIGKAKELKNRLSSYNKTAEHEVIYYKECKSKEDMNIIEQIVLNKLKDYREKANRDRFILPVEKDISFFTNIIDQSIIFIN